MVNIRRFLASALLVMACVAAPRAHAVDGFIFGGSVGYVGVSGNGNIGFGPDLGIKVNSRLSLLYHFQYSSHSSVGISSKLLANFLTADFELFDANDLYMSIGAGPGLYINSFTGGSLTNFGLNFGGELGVKVEDTVKVGVNFRYHVLLDSAAANYFTAMASIGFLFGG